MYTRQGRYLGHYSNTASIANVSTNEEDFGLDVYEPLFFRSPAEWTELGPFEIKFTVTDETIQSDMFYFCHIHEFMVRAMLFLGRYSAKANHVHTYSLFYVYTNPTC